MGGFSLTNPGLVENGGQGVDPTTGAPIQLPPIVRYFKNAALRGHQAALDEMATVQPGTSTMSGPRTSANPGGAPQIPLAGDPDQNTVSDVAPSSSIPKFFQPSFRNVAGPDANGLPQPVNPAETKLGKLVHILAAAGQGALAGWGTGNPGAGAAQAREIPFQEAQQRNTLEQEQAQTALTRSQSQMVQTPYGPMPAGMAKLIFPALIKAGATTGAAQIGANSRQTVAQTQAESAANVANINKRFIPIPDVGLVDTQTRDENGAPTLVPNTQKGIIITPEIAADHNLPAAFIGKPLQLSSLIAMAPKVSSESSTTDLMGNTRTGRTTQPVLSAPGATAPVAVPGGAATAPGPRPANMVQRTAGGPLQPVAAAGGAATPRRTAAAGASAGSGAAVNPLYALAPDVEQRLAASGLSPQEQQYVRGLLTYSGRMPSNRAKNYADTLSTLHTIDPSFSDTNYDAIHKTKLDYSPGGVIGQQVLAFNTALRHLGTLYDAAQQLDNGNWQLANKIANALSIQFGSDKVTNFNTIKTYLTSELAKGFGGGVATDTSRAEAAPILAAYQSPEQTGGAFKTASDLLRGKVGAQESAYQRQVGKPISLLDDESHGTLQKLGLEAPQMVTIQDPNGHLQQMLASDWKKNQSAIVKKYPGTKLAPIQ